MFPTMNTFWNLIVTMRPKQWTKNLVLFAGVVFSREFTDPALVKASFYGFAVFCILSGSIYMINDVIDRKRDLDHPVKAKRPLASGELSPALALGVSVALLAASLAAAALLGTEFLLFASAFVAVNLLYSFVLKSVVILDAISISFSFLLRAGAGVAVLHPYIPDLEFSPWLWICTLFLSLFLAICKRRHELTRLADAAGHRSSLKDYSAQLLDQLVGLTATASVISYSIYTVWPTTVSKFGTTALVYTIPFVAFGLMRYLYLVYNRHSGGDPSGVLLTEKAIIIDVFLWFVAVLFIIS